MKALVLVALLLLTGCITPRYNDGICTVDSKLLGKC